MDPPVPKKVVITDEHRRFGERFAAAIRQEITASIARLKPDAQLDRAPDAADDASDNTSARLTAQIESLNKRVAVLESYIAKQMIEGGQAQKDDDGAHQAKSDSYTISFLNDRINSLEAGLHNLYQLFAAAVDFNSGRETTH
jgi:hypothetical protein